VLLPGMFVRARVDEAVAPQAILVPQQGISRDAKGNATALVVDGAGKVQLRTATAARAIGDQWLITAGLEAGDRLIVQGSSKVRPGDAVKVVDVGTSARAATASPQAAAASAVIAER
jgi:membrane fusion protein (multidrug efflux system)